MVVVGLLIAPNGGSLFRTGIIRIVGPIAMAARAKSHDAESRRSDAVTSLRRFGPAESLGYFLPTTVVVTVALLFLKSTSPFTNAVFP